jgi:hypothetical protein
MAVAATHVTLLEPAERRAERAGLRDALRHVPLLLVLGLVVGMHVPTLGYYFFGDDFVVLGDIRTRGFTDYARDVVLLRDLTPNWRPLTMLVYWTEFQAFGFNALPWRILNLALHTATVAALYVLVV